LHRIYGLSVALNAGNWLYFQPFEWIEKLGLPIEKELNLYRLSHEAMLKAHVGQALDLGTKLNEIDRGNAKTVCMTALRLKTGSLMSLALKMGACIAGASKERIEELNEFGTEFGVALQMFDDIGNFTLPLGDSKRLEDFRLKRPTWLWACAAENSSDSAYEKFLLAVSRIPNEAPLREWVDKNNLVAIAREQAKAYLESAFERFGQSSGGWSKYTKTRSVLNEIAGRIQLIYG
jgi:geranylgeranyl pyrophosphate synthase